jgi:hypothetical protein
MQVGHLGALSEEIVRLCNSAPWAAITNKTLVVDLLSGACRLDDDHRPSTGAADVTLLCPLNPIIAELSAALARKEPLTRQHALLFPPVDVARETRRRAM